MSTDDLYHTHENLVRVAKSNPLNKLLVGRGQPGTHDIPLGKQIFEALATINETKAQVKLPLFDKSLFSGEGDRIVDQCVTVWPPVDVFILEGWQMGFAAIEEDEIKNSWQSAKEESPLKNYRLEDLLDINENLKEYQREWYKYFTVFVQVSCLLLKTINIFFFLQIKAKDLNDVYKWRTQQEREMKAKNGGIGMSDQQVKWSVLRLSVVTFTYQLSSSASSIGTSLHTFCSSRPSPPLKAGRAEAKQFWSDQNAR